MIRTAARIAQALSASEKAGTRPRFLRLAKWREKSWSGRSIRSIRAVPLDYPPTDSGTFLKDAAVLAGMGVIGKNNLLITPEFGPRVRLKALALETELPPSEGQANFDPCSSCAAPCWAACPQAAFASGRYDRARCQIQMKIDESSPLDPADANAYNVSYCRQCETACPIGET